MTFGVAVVLFALCVIGIVLVGRFLREKKRVRVLCTVVLSVAALVLAIYMGLTVIFVDAVQNQPPTP